MECSYCERACEIPEETNGHCRMYRNEKGKITENYPDAYLNIYPVSSESIPMLHFYPNSIFLLISTIGCNFSCEGCISEFQTTRPGTLQEVLTPYTPEEILAIAREGGCKGITFCLNEPTVSLPTFLRVAQVAKGEGLLVGCSSNGYMTPETLQAMIPYLDFINIGLKGSTDGRYKECGAKSAGPVYRNVKSLYDAGVAVEVSVMYINGRESEVTGASDRIRKISPAIPFQVMRFVATHENLKGSEPDREQGEHLCTELRKYLDHVYLFNTPATTELDSRCPVCGETILHRVFFGPMAARVLSCRTEGICSCGYRFPCRGEIEPIPKTGPRLLGGYKSVMGARYIVDLLTFLGVKDDLEIDRICNTVIASGYLRELQDKEDSVETFTGMLRYIAGLAQREEAAERITDYVQSVFNDIGNRAADAEKPRVYVVFCHPLFPVYAAKFVNSLVETAGGTSVNREQDFRESADAEYSVQALNQLDPEVILVTGPSVPSLGEFLDTCKELGITCRGISEHRVYLTEGMHATGSLGWIISLMDVANILHPEIFHYSLAEEKEKLDRAVTRFMG
ncbi:MAG TPA: radical SAM protein [Methanoregulaceae archaeon]|nr:radical SAM protein [Methanoregulaceae archaeon]